MPGQALRLLVVWLTVILAGLAGAPAVRAEPSTCTATLRIFTTSLGTSSTQGQTTIVQDSGVGGQYTAGFLAGYTISGAQDIVINRQTNTAQLRGSFIATGPGGTLTIQYTGHANLTTGAATGRFQVMEGTGTFENFHWAGGITAQLVSQTPPTFIATDTGPCFTAP